VSSTLPLAEIAAAVINARIWKASEKDDAQLVASIKALGVLTPITVRPAPDSMSEGGAIRWIVVTGNRRYAAAKAAGLTEIPAHVVADDRVPAEIAIAQLHENEVRAAMSLPDVWEAIATATDPLIHTGRQLSTQAIAVGLNVPKRLVERLQACGRLPREIADHIRKTGDIPHDSQLRTMLAADGKALLDAWQKHGPKKPTETGCWYAVVSPLRYRRIEARHAVFDVTDDLKSALQHELDLFDPADHAGYFRNVEPFMEMQKLALEAKHADLVKLGFGVVWQDTPWSPPAGHTHDEKPVGAGRSMKKADRPGWSLCLSINTEGEAHAKLLAKVVPKAAAKAADPATGSGAGGDAAPEPDPAVMTAKGAEAVETSKRHAVADGIEMSGNAIELLSVALLLLRERTSMAVVPALLDEHGRAELTDHEKIMAEAKALLRDVVLHQHSRGSNIGLWLIERIGAGLGQPAIWHAAREDLDTLKRPAIEKLRRDLHVMDYPTQKAVKDGLMRTTQDATLRLNEGLLPALAWDAASPMPHGWSRYDPADDEPFGDDDENDADALASAGMGTDEDYGGERDETA